MEDIIDTIEQDDELATEGQDDAEEGCEVLTDGDDTGPAYEDHLREIETLRVKRILPRGIKYLVNTGHGYLEAHCENRSAADADTEVNEQVSLHLVDERFADRADQLRDTLESAVVCGDRLLELEWFHGTNGFAYLVSLDGKTIGSYRHIALARLVWTLLADRKPETYRHLAVEIANKFYSKGSEMGEAELEECSEGFTKWVLQTAGV